MNQPTPEQTLNIKLTIGEYNFLHALLSDLPTKTNAWVLRNSIERQAQAQAQAKNIPVVDPNAPAQAPAANNAASVE
jgi:ATP phosphoribosyltransferase regulatory subunit HisZ